MAENLLSTIAGRGGLRPYWHSWRVLRIIGSTADVP